MTEHSHNQPPRMERVLSPKQTEAFEQMVRTNFQSIPPCIDDSGHLYRPYKIAACCERCGHQRKCETAAEAPPAQELLRSVMGQAWAPTEFFDRIYWNLYGTSYLRPEPRDGDAIELAVYDDLADEVLARVERTSLRYGGKTWRVSSASRVSPSQVNVTAVDETVIPR